MTWTCGPVRGANLEASECPKFQNSGYLSPIAVAFCQCPNGSHSDEDSLPSQLG